MATPNLLECLPLPERAVAVAGLFRTRSGLQRGAQLLLSDILRRGHAVNAVDLSAPLGFQLDRNDAGLLLPGDLAGLSVDALLICVNPPRFAEALAAFPEAVRRKARIIGYWVWELDVLPDDWPACASLCDALWAPSPFVADTLRRALPDFPGEIAVVPYPVNLDPMPPVSPDARARLRLAHGLAEDAFVCGVSFAIWSNITRKNPQAAIQAFRRAFPAGDEKTVLLIRAHDSADFPDLYRALMALAAQDPRIRVFDPRFESWPMPDFLACLDVFLSLHRSEGYGLPLAEAAQMGVAVLATGWGLAPDIAARPQVRPVDFTLIPIADAQHFYDQFVGARWAEPDVEKAAALLRALIKS